VIGMKGIGQFRMDVAQEDGGGIQGGVASQIILYRGGWCGEREFGLAAKTRGAQRKTQRGGRRVEPQRSQRRALTPDTLLNLESVSVSLCG